MAEQEIATDRDEQVIGTPERDRLQDHHEHTENHANQNRFQTPRVREQQQWQMRREERRREAGDRTFERFRLFGRLEANSPVVDTNEGSRRVGEGERQNGNAEEDWVAIGHDVYDASSDGKVEATPGAPFDSVDNLPE